jgi:hypothetical protein
VTCADWLNTTPTGGSPCAKRSLRLGAASSALSRLSANQSIGIGNACILCRACIRPLSSGVKRGSGRAMNVPMPNSTVPMSLSQENGKWVLNYKLGVSNSALKTTCSSNTCRTHSGVFARTAPKRCASALPTLSWKSDYTDRIISFNGYWILNHHTNLNSFELVGVRSHRGVMTNSLNRETVQSPLSGRAPLSRRSS